MEIALLRGRFFAPGDNEHAPLVTVVDETFARKFFPGQDPIGKRINLDGRDNTALAMQIVGIVKHVKQWGLDSDEKGLQAQLYRPFMQLPDQAIALSASGAGIVMRSREAAPGLFDSIRSVLHQTNREQVVFGPQTMDEAISASLAARRYSMLLLSGFAALALILASIGIYGVVSYVVNERTQEIGIRMALGASRGNVLRLILGQGARMAIFGVAAGLAVSLALARLLAGLLYGIKPTDPVTFVVVAVLLCSIALLACYLPARRATRVDPTVALKCD
jgi:predicted permease